METIRFLLAAIAVLLCFISVTLAAISKRLRQHFPTEKEADYDFSQRDPMGHWEAHKPEKK